MPAPKYTDAQWDKLGDSLDSGERTGPSKELMDRYDRFNAGEEAFERDFIKKYGKRGEFKKFDKMWDGRDKASDANFRSLFTEAEGDSVMAAADKRDAKRDSQPKVKKLKGSTSTRPAEVAFDAPTAKPAPRPAPKSVKRQAAKRRRGARTDMRDIIPEAGGGGHRASSKPVKPRTSKTATMVDYAPQAIGLPEEAGNRSMATDKQLEMRAKAAKKGLKGAK
jgi:hypothetical protein